MSVRKGPISPLEFMLLVSYAVTTHSALRTEEFATEIRDLLRRLQEFEALDVIEHIAQDEENTLSEDEKQQRIEWGKNR